MEGNGPDPHPDVYEFDRVVFGVNPSLFQAQFVLLQHAKLVLEDISHMLGKELENDYVV